MKVPIPVPGLLARAVTGSDTIHNGLLDQAGEHVQQVTGGQALISADPRPRPARTRQRTPTTWPTNNRSGLPHKLNDHSTHARNAC